MEETNGENQSKKFNRTVFDHFEHLISANEKNRIKGSLNILKHFNTVQEKDIEVNHALTRIIRGLGSSTNIPRTGFYTILVALLNFRNDISLSQIFDLMEKHLHKAGSNAKSENADILTGQILACGAIVRSNLWSKTTHEEKLKIVECILTASKERTYQGLLAFEFITNIFEKVEDKDFYALCPLLKDEVSKPLENYTLDSLYLLNNMKKKYPQLPKKLKSVIVYPEVLSEENIGKLCRILMIIPKLSSLQHPVYDIISIEAATSSNLNHFLEELDWYLDIPNRNKLLVATKIYTILLEKLEDVSVVPNILTKNFVHQMLNHFKTLKGKDQDVEFKQSINKFFEQLLEKLKPEDVNSKIKIAVLKKLLFSPGTFIFEKITHSKVVQNITWSLNVDGVKKLVAVYRGVIEGSEIVASQYGHGDYWLNNDKLYAAHLLIKLLNHKAVREENDWKTEQLIFLMELGLLKDTQVRIGSELSASLKTAFFGALNLKLAKLEQLHTILLSVVLHLNSKLTPENLETALRSTITIEQYEIWEKTISIITKIEKKKKKGGLRSVFLTLFLHLALLLFNDAKLAVDSLNELFVCYEKTKKSRKNSEAMDETAVEDASGEDVMWIEVVTDLFLNFLSQNSHLLRNIVNLVFPYLCENMTTSTIQQLVSVLDPENENPLSKGNNHSDEDDSDEESESEKEDESDDSNNEEDDDDDDNDMEDESANDKLRMALQKVLTSNGYQSDEESIDIDQMSDTEGEKLDKALADAFKQFRPNHGKRKKQNEDQRALTHFRVRVLDLIEIYLDSNPSMIITLEIMLPLLKTVEFSVRDEHQAPLLHRLKSCLKKLSNLKKFENTDGVDDAVLCDLLKSLLDKGTKNTWIVQDMREQISHCCIFTIKCSDLLSNAEATPKKVKKRLKNSIVELIRNELDTYFNKRECATPFLVFKNLLKISWDGNLTLVTTILKYLFDANVKVFKKSQGLELVLSFYTNQRYLRSNTEKIREALNESHEEFSNNAITLFKSLCETERKVPSEKFLCNMFKLLVALKTSVLNIECMKWPAIAESVREFMSTVTLSKEAKTAFNKLCACLNVSNIVRHNPVVTSSTNNDEKATKGAKEKKKNKKTKNKEKLKLKKEAKELRLQSLSEGFKSLDFAVADDEVTMETNEESEEDSNNKSKKQKKRKSSENSVEGEKFNDVNTTKKSKKKRKNSENAESGTAIVNGVIESHNKKKKHKT
ncbi:myb-binding protein 1A [Diabrotica virgifera virgifera]|uniref:Myb-binding protein 1A-like n=1 Tax=Diabrotica virgifera virgifera TaxID=50390 RepID=A0A6P7HAN6_DIAVI|nr:myb-binding protein 1A [Diabrotica virgifera virgifera]